MSAASSLAAGPPDALRVDALTTHLHLPGRRIAIVDGISFRIEAGRTLCLVGESGCGKSLAARSLLRLVDPPLEVSARSRILLGGRDLNRLGEDELRSVRGREIAMIFQEPMSYLNPVYTVGDQVSETVITHRGATRREALDRTMELFRSVGITSPERRIHQYPHELSGGMQQRVLIAMALACEPRVLIADEPTTALDVTIQAQILDLLRRLQDQLDMAILMITHDLGVVAEMADEVAVMYAGSIVESGPTRRVLDAPQHPYTEALLQSIPRLGMARGRSLKAIAGMVPPPTQWPSGCRFRPRCPQAFEACVETPPLFSAAGHAAACWLRRDGARPVAGA